LLSKTPCKGRRSKKGKEKGVAKTRLRPGCPWKVNVRVSSVYRQVFGKAGSFEKDAFARRASDKDSLRRGAVQKLIGSQFRRPPNASSVGLLMKGKDTRVWGGSVGPKLLSGVE